MFKKLARAATAVGSAVAGFGAIVAVKAADLSLPTPENQNLEGSGTGEEILSDIAQRVINIIFLLAGILAVIYLLWSGVQYITAGGNADRVKAARQGIINAVIGIIILFAAFFIVRFAVGIGRTVENADESVYHPVAERRVA